MCDLQRVSPRWGRFIAAGVGAYNRGRGIGGFIVVGGGLPACNGATGKRRLKQRSYDWWREILHGEMTDNGSLSRCVRGGRQLLWFGERGFGRRFYILQNNVVLMLKKKKFNRTV